LWITKTVRDKLSQNETVPEIEVIPQTSTQNERPKFRERTKLLYAEKKNIGRNIASAEGVTGRTLGRTPLPSKTAGKPPDYEMAQRIFLFEEITRYFRKRFAGIDEFSIRPIKLNHDARKRFLIPESDKKPERTRNSGNSTNLKTENNCDDDSASSCKYFQLCRSEQAALLIEVSVDSATCKSECKIENVKTEQKCNCIGRVKLTIYSLNLNLLDSSDCFDYKLGNLLNIPGIPPKKYFR